MPQTKTPQYQVLKAELEAILLALQRDDLDIDEALERYERGLHIIKQLTKYLQTAENKVTELKASFNPES